MAVKDFMTRKVVYISPDTTVAHAADLMREQGLHRLPVIENDQLVGLGKPAHLKQPVSLSMR